jgi:hypothetical protein
MKEHSVTTRLITVLRIHASTAGVKTTRQRRPINANAIIGIGPGKGASVKRMYVVLTTLARFLLTARTNPPSLEDTSAPVVTAFPERIASPILVER